jgi:hypothetical protein
MFTRLKEKRESWKGRMQGDESWKGRVKTSSVIRDGFSSSAVDFAINAQIRSFILLHSYFLPLRLSRLRRASSFRVGTKQLPIHLVNCGKATARIDG